MSDTTGAPDAQEESGAQPQEGTSSPAQVAGAPAKPEATDESGTVTVAALQAEIRAKNREAQSLRSRLATLETAEKERQEAELSEVEKRDRKIAELERQLSDKDRQAQERLVRLETVRHASRLGFIDPEDAALLLPSGAIEFDDDGTPKNVEAVLKQLLKDKPHLASAQARASGDFGNGSRGQPAKTDPQPGYDRLVHAYSSSEEKGS